MSKFGYMTVKGSYNRTPSGIYTYKNDYPEEMPDRDIYTDLKRHAKSGRSGRWMSSSTYDTVVGCAILPSVIDTTEYTQATMNVESWHYRNHASSGGEAFMSLEGAPVTSEVFDCLHKQAERDWRSRNCMTTLGYVAVSNFQLLRG